MQLFLTTFLEYKNVSVRPSYTFTTHTTSMVHIREESTLSDNVRLTNLAQNVLASELDEMHLPSSASSPNIQSPRPSSPQDNESPTEILRRNLSVHTIVSTSSSFAERMEKARSPHQSLNVIGRGTCGTVFEVPGTESAYKKGQDEEALWNDANLTSLAYHAVADAKSTVAEIFPSQSVPRVPGIYGWVSDEEKETWWKDNLHRFPKSENKIGSVFIVQRILPLPKVSRKAIIEQYFPVEHQQQAIMDQENKACLVRPYLGQRRGQRELENPPISLLNYPLYLDQMEQIGLDIAQYSKEMAIGLAIIHWKAFLDGMDMEFVIGSAALTLEVTSVIKSFNYIKPFSIPSASFRRRQTHLWMLDFDKATQLDMKTWKSARAKLVVAVTANDPYFPNPAASGKTESLAWGVFEDAYLRTAKAISTLR